MDAQMLDKKLEKMCKKSKVVGVNVALFDSKGIIYNYNSGFANMEKGIKSDNDSLYMIGSNTKVMTALGILKLREEGKLSFDDDIKKFISEFEVKSYFAYDKITIENLLMHRSGLVSDLFQLILDRTRDYHEVIAELKDTYLTAKPGKMFYSYYTWHHHRVYFRAILYRILGVCETPSKKFMIVQNLQFQSDTIRFVI